jgi:hypothetical protein
MFAFFEFLFALPTLFENFFKILDLFGSGSLIPVFDWF